jgi:predicted nucleic-acid-binding protein
MIGIDTNVLVRYIMQDDAKQSPKATKLMEALTVDAPGFVSQVSIIELVWVLGGSYELTRRCARKRWSSIGPGLEGAACFSSRVS